jgi:hypothetical protein
MSPLLCGASHGPHSHELFHSSLPSEDGATTPRARAHLPERSVSRDWRATEHPLAVGQAGDYRWAHGTKTWRFLASCASPREAAFRGREAAPRHGGESSGRSRARRIPASGGGPRGDARRVAGGCAGSLEPRRRDRQTHGAGEEDRRAGAAAPSQGQGAGRSGRASAAPKKLQALWAVAEDDTEPPSDE